MSRTWLPAVLLVAILPVGLLRGDEDVLKAARDRRKIEAQQVQREFEEGRLAAYKLVRSDDPKLAEATDKLKALLAVIEKDTSLESAKREQYVVTLKWDLDRVKEIAAERTKKARVESPPPSVVRRDTPPRGNDDDRRSPAKDAKSVIDRRKDALEDARRDRETRNERNNRVQRDVVRSSIPATEVDRFPKDWVEKSRKRGGSVRMTAKEKAIMEALNKTLDVDFSGYTFSEVIDLLKKQTGIDIAVDKRGLDEANVTYDTKINLKLKASTRTIIRRLLSDLGLAYYIKDEALQVTSLERASKETTIRTYYVGDLALVTDTRIPFDLTRLQMISTVNTIADLIKSIEPQSWKDNNPDAPGTIVFDPVRMTLVIRQTAEFHFRMAGK